MLIALFADIHANRLALEACLSQARALGADRFVFLGDLVGYGPEPEEVVQGVRHLCERGAIAIMSNHDHAAVSAGGRMNGDATRAMAWTRSRLSADSLGFLARLPLTAMDEDRLYVHADAASPARWNYVTGPDEARFSLMATRARLTFCGHTHAPAMFGLSETGKLVTHKPVTNVPVPLLARRQWLAVVGSVGQPRDGNPSAAFATYDTQSVMLTYRRASYDAEAAALSIRASGLPDRLAERLLAGV